MSLTNIQIKNLRPKEKPYKVFDFDGLYVLVNKNGSRLFRFKFRIHGKEKLLSFGKYPDISLLQARQMRDEARSKIAIGIDPSAFKKNEKAQGLLRSTNTFGKISADYLKKIEAEGRAVTTLKKVSSFMAIANSELGALPITDITSPIVLSLLKKIEKKGHYETANRLRGTIGAVCRYAIANGFLEIDPTYALKDALIRSKPKSRAAIIDKTQLGGLLQSIDDYQGQNTTRIALKLLSMLASRPGELRFAKWAEFDLVKNVWLIPADRMKMRIAHQVPLPKQAIELLLELEPETAWGELLFPSNRSAKRPISENTLNAALRRMGYTKDEMTSHGFRATFSTLANESGLWHPDAIERALAHVEQNEIRRAYARSTFWEERVRLADWWAGLLVELKSQ